MSYRSVVVLVLSAVVVTLLAAFCARVFAQASEEPTPAPSQALQPNLGGTEGRYKVVIREGVRADTFLLDTLEGRVWRLTQYTDIKGQPTVWLYMERLDSQTDVMAFSLSQAMTP